MIMIPQPQANLHGFAPMSAGSTNMDSVSVQNGSLAVCTTSQEHQQDTVRHNDASSNYDMILQQEEVRIAHQLQVLQQAWQDFHQTRHRRTIPANQLAIQMMNQYAGAECMRPPATITEQEVTHASHRPLPTTSLVYTAASNAPPVLPPLDMQPSIQDDVSNGPFPSCSNGSHDSGSRHLVERVASATRISGRHSSSSASSKTSSSTKQSAPQDFSLMSFQIKLFDMLAQDEAYSKYIAWMPHGRAFKVLVTDKNVIEFEDNVLQKYFRSKKVASFMRQVNGWGFKRINDRNHRDFGAYFHPQFVRDRLDLVHQMKRPGRGEDPLSWVRSDGGMNAMYQNPDFYKLVEEEKKEQAFKNWQQQNVMQEPNFMPRQKEQHAHGLEMVDFQQPLHPRITAPSESLFSLCQRRVSSGDQSLQRPSAMAHQASSSFFATKAAPMKQAAEAPRPELQCQQEVLDDFDPQDIEGRGNDYDDDDEVTLSTIGTSIFDDVDDEWSRQEEEERSHYSDASSLASCELSN